MTSTLAPVLLTAASYYGTLAAARCLGRRGIPVTMAEGRLLAPARWSRFVSRRVSCPDVGDAGEFLRWAKRFGEASPGHVLYPTTDDLAWLLAKHRDELGRSFKLYSPGVDAVYALLNKKRLHAAATEAGLETPRTWFPRSREELAGIAGEARFPLLVKPQTQVLFESHSKGARAEGPGDLAARWSDFAAANRCGPKMLEFDPEAGTPILQELHAEAAQGIYSLSGFVDETGELFVCRASTKVLQRPRKLGIGLCFEAAPVDGELAEKVRRMCARLGYFGVFEAEFIGVGDRKLLIDFNPRLYSQMAFDVDRGMPLPLLAYLGATGDRETLKAEVLHARLRQARTQPERVYTHHFILEVLLRGQGVSGKLSADEVSTWRRWLAEHDQWTTDAVADPDDGLPAMVDVAQHLFGYARHPRAFVRSMILDA
ncbi:MAG TPA: carbamoyl-phosphate synthase [Myxococcales bacterium]|jgi:predicted ATP-grasp superfamily ATP-dependent carboligase